MPYLACKSSKCWPGLNFDVYTVYVRVACSSRQLCWLDKLLVLDIRSAKALLLSSLKKRRRDNLSGKMNNPFYSAIRQTFLMARSKLTVTKTVHYL